MPPSHSSELYRAVPQPNLLQTGGMAVAGLMGMTVAPLPSVSRAQGVGEAMYASGVNARIWEQMQQGAIAQMAQGIGYNIGQAGTNMGLPSMMGMSTTEFQRMVNRGMGSAMGMGVVGQIANLPMLHQLMGGNVMGTYQSAFGNRNLFGQPLGFAHPMDMQAQAQAANYSMALNNGLMQAAYGTPGGGIGLMPNYNFTRGFSVNDIQSSMVRMQQGGRWRAGEDIGARVADMGKMTRTFEALGDFMGSRDMDQLMGALTKLTQGRWERANPEQLTAGLRQLQGMAQVLGRTKDEMVSTVTQIQSALQGGVGIGASQLAMGVTAGGYGGFGAAGGMAARVYSIAAARGENRPEDINRIMMQQTALHNMGMGSYAGRAAQLAAYMSQEGMLSDTDYAGVMKGLTYGDAGGKVSVVNDLLRRKFGSEAEGMARLNDPRFMTMIRAATGESKASDVMSAIRMGQSLEWRDRVLSAGRTELGRTLSGIQGQMGVTGALGGNNAVAGAQADAVLGFFTAQGQGTSANFLRSVYSDAIAGGKSQAQAYSLMMSRMHGNIGQQYWGGAEAAAQKAALGAGLGAVNAGGVTGADANAILQGLRSSGAVDTFSAETKSAFYAAQKQLSKGDYAGALAAAEGLLGNASPEAQAVINDRRGIARSQAASAVAEANRRSESLSRFERGTNMGLSIGGIGTMQGEFTKQLTDIDARLRGGGSMADAKAMIVAGLGAESGQALSKPQQAMRNFLGGSVVEKLFKASTPEDISNLLKEQRAVELWDKTTRSAAAAGRGVPIELSDMLSTGEKEFMAEANIRAMSLSTGIMNQAAADTGQGLRATTGQLALGLAQGTVSPLRMLGLSDGSMSYLGGGAQSRIKKWMRQSQGYINAMGSANNKVQGALESVMEDAMGSPDGGAAIGSMVSAFQSQVGSGGVSLSDSKTFDKFMSGYSQMSASTQTKMRTLYDSMHAGKAASEDFLKHRGTLDDLRQQIDSANTVATGQKAVARGHMEDAAGGYIDSGLAVVGAMTPSFFGGGAEKAAVMRLLGKKNGMLTKVTQADYQELAKRFSSRESLSQLSAEGMEDAAVLFRSAQRKFNKGENGGDKGTTHIKGTIQLIDGNTKRTGLVNFSEG